MVETKYKSLSLNFLWKLRRQERESLKVKWDSDFWEAKTVQGPNGQEKSFKYHLNLPTTIFWLFTQSYIEMLQKVGNCKAPTSSTFLFLVWLWVPSIKKSHQRTHMRHPLFTRIVLDVLWKSAKNLLRSQIDLIIEGLPSKE